MATTGDFVLTEDEINPVISELHAHRPITLLRLRDGSMYGLTDYRVKDGELH